MIVATAIDGYIEVCVPVAAPEVKS